MAARLGNVIYWLGWTIAILAGLIGALMVWDYSTMEIEGVKIYDEQRKAWRDMLPRERADHIRYRDLGLSNGLIFLGVSFGSWLIGRIARYILAGR